MKKLFRFLLYFIGAVLLLIVLILFITIIPIDRTPASETKSYSIMMNRLDSLEANLDELHGGKFNVGFAVENLTPNQPLPTAGYGNRRGKQYTSILDSIFVRTIVVDNGIQRVAIVSADLLIIPPTVTALLEKKLPSIGYTLENTYLNATHTHNSIGSWAEGITGIIYGSYDDTVVNFIADKIITCIRSASSNLKEASIKTGSIPVPNAVRNRLDGIHGQVDSLLRVVEINRTDNTRLIMVSYNAHPTCLFSKDLSLSRDYPGKLVDNLEASGYDFAMFLAGAVGSHGCNPPEFGDACIDWMADELTAKVNFIKPSLKEMEDSSLLMIRIPLALAEPQVKISQNWRLRPWVFESAFGEYEPYLTALRIGDLVLLGTPCDFSGELSSSVDSVASDGNVDVIITSFNGHYIGYITRDSYYDSPHYETRLMNWYGPGNGAYISECLERMVKIISD